MVLDDLCGERGRVSPIKPAQGHQAHGGRPNQGAANSGLKETTTSTGSSGTCSITASSSSIELGSDQCASSNRNSTGSRRARPDNRRASAVNVRVFRCCGLSSRAG